VPWKAANCHRLSPALLYGRRRGAYFCGRHRL
jgi:hypothetical protein